MPKLEDVLKIKVDQPTQAQRLTLLREYGRTPRKTPKHPLPPDSQEPDHG